MTFLYGTGMTLSRGDDILYSAIDKKIIVRYNSLNSKRMEYLTHQSGRSA
jgi:hypothetical protein